MVTGTLISGGVGAADEVELLPERKLLRVRGVQSGGKTVERALAGQRTAVNLAGIEHTALKRGMVLAAPGKFRATRRIDTRLAVAAIGAKVEAAQPSSFSRRDIGDHGGSFSVRPRANSRPGQSALAQLRLQDEVLVLPGDRFIVRQFSPVTTIGGGVVLDALARRPLLRDTGRVAFLETLERGDKVEILAAMAERALGGVAFRETRGAHRLAGQPRFVTSQEN